MRQGLVDLQTTGTEVTRTYAMGLLASAYGRAGQTDDGVALLNEALATIYASGERWTEAELHRFKAELLLQEGNKELEAEESFLQALNVARRQQAKSLELRVAVSLCCLWQRQDKRRSAYQLLEEVYGWFTEGFDTVDLKEAKALLEELA